MTSNLLTSIVTQSQAKAKPAAKYGWFAEVRVRSTTTYYVRYRSNTGSNPEENGWINLGEVNTLDQAERQASDLRHKYLELQILSICRAIVKRETRR